MAGWNRLIRLGVFAAIVATAGALAFSEQLGPSRPSSDLSRASLAKAVARLGQSVPSMVDSDTEITKVTALDGRILYEYRLVKVDSKRIDAAALLADLKKKVAARLCDANEFLKSGVIFEYVYLDKSATRIGTFEITSMDCFSRSPTAK